MYIGAVGKAKEVKSQWDPNPLTLRYTICAAELAFLATSAGARFGDEEEEADDSLEAIDEAMDILEAVGETKEVKLL